jgi:hypothetical protein
MIFPELLMMVMVSAIPTGLHSKLGLAGQNGSRSLGSG